MNNEGEAHGEITKDCNDSNNMTHVLKGGSYNHLTHIPNTNFYKHILIMEQIITVRKNNLPLSFSNLVQIDLIMHKFNKHKVNVSV